MSVARVFVVAALCLAPVLAQAQPNVQPARLPRVGVLSLHHAQHENAANIGGNAFRRGMQALGYSEGRSINIDVRHADGDRARLQALAAEFAAMQVDVIVAFGTDATQAARTATSKVPIVMAAVNDPLGSKFVESLARPGGNITGIALMNPEMAEKQLEMLKEAAPHIQRVLCLRLQLPVHDRLFAELEHKARSLGVAVISATVTTEEDVRSRFEEMSALAVDAYLIFANPTLDDMREQIAALGLRHRLPGAGHQPFFVDAGVLLSYGPSLSELHARSAGFVDRILKGAIPADLPVEQAERFRLAINLKTAEALGLSIPPTLLARADEVIE